MTKIIDEAAELISVHQRSPVPETDDPRGQRSQSARGIEVGSTVGRGELKRLGQAPSKRHGIPVKQDVSEDQYPVVFSPECQVTWSVPGCLDHFHSADFIALGERTGNVVTRPGESGGYR